MDVRPEDSLITTGCSRPGPGGQDPGQRGRHRGHGKTGYLGAIQAFTIFRPCGAPCPLRTTGRTGLLDRALKRAKTFYARLHAPEPSGLSYSEEKRARVAELLKRHRPSSWRDEPYGELASMVRPCPRSETAPELSCSWALFMVQRPSSAWLDRGARVLMERLVIAKRRPTHTGSSTR
jgi:2-aminoadipate transaminase